MGGVKVINFGKVLLLCAAVFNVSAFGQAPAGLPPGGAKQMVPLPVPVLLTKAEERRAQILAETPEQEAEEQAKVVEKIGKPEYTWRVCDDELHSQFIFAQLTSPGAVSKFDGKTVGEVCYSWLGTRKAWKASILQEGCRKRCAFY
jgi:hypothetical protein